MKFYEYTNNRICDGSPINGTIDQLPNWMLQLVIDNNPLLRYPREPQPAIAEQARIILALRERGEM